MNPYFTLSAIFLLGLRGIEKKLKLGPPITHFTPEDRKTGKVSRLINRHPFLKYKFLSLSDQGPEHNVRERY